MNYNLITDVIFPQYSNDIEELWEMAKCGETDDGLYIIIFSNDGGWIPHFHVFNNQNPNKATFDACLKIETPEYFKHGSHTDILNNKQMKSIVDFLQGNDEDGDSNWKYIIKTWNKNNSKQNIPINTPIPDYMSLIGQKEN